MKPVSTLLFLLVLLFTGLSSVEGQGIYQLWGMTRDGGSDDVGRMFSTTGAGNNFTERHQFNIVNPGANPQLTNLVEYNGKFYGMTEQGGNFNAGVIFEWDPSSNTYTKRFSFDGTTGSGPLGSLTLYNNKFYGTTQSGGDQSQGVIFEWDPATGIYNKKIDFIDNFFDGYNGYLPVGNLTMSDGKFYGTTAGGGNDDKGTIFEWDPSTNTFVKKFDFNGSNGHRPFGTLSLKSGKLYGMTTTGGANDLGVIFEWNLSTNVFTKKRDFNGTNGSYPYGSLVLKGSGFIGMTQQGGVNDDGVIFEWNPSTNVYSKKYEFNNTDGYWPGGDLVLKGTKYYGTTARGGNNDAGVIFEWDPTAASYTVKSDFHISDGRSPVGLTLSGEKLFGMATLGGSSNKGVIFEFDCQENSFHKKIDFNDLSSGINPAGAICNAGGKYYGMTNLGGVNNAGVIFEMDASNGYTKKFDLDPATGSNPTGSLTAGANGKLYGMMNSGGDNSEGVIFEWDPASNTYSKKVDLSFTEGSFPQGSLRFLDGKFYGMTSSGGDNGGGVIFEWDPASNVYTRKINLSSATGSKPYGDLYYLDSKFYGMTNKGGSSGGGVIFEWDPVTNVYTKKIDLTSTTGKSPYGSLNFYEGKFYGMTSAGGAGNKGVIFEWDPSSNAYTKMMDFSSTDAFSPAGNLSLSSDKFYGMTRQGGAHGGGVVFEWNPVTNEFTKKNDLNAYTGGALPGIITDMALAQAPVAKGVGGTCTSYAPVTIDNSNNNVWVPIIDENGDAIAEINANGHNLGVVNTSIYINEGTTREDGSKRLYLDRNISISAQFPLIQGATANVRLYIRKNEFVDLKNASNSMGQPSGILGISDLGIFKNEEPCSPSLSVIANPVLTNSDSWGADYVLSATVDSFTSFYFANKAEGGPLPVTTLEIIGRLEKADAAITWKTTDEFKTKTFELERSIDGATFKGIATVTAVNQLGVHQYNYTDKNVIATSAAVLYYRIRQNDLDGKFNYSKVVPISIKNNNVVLLYPNPVISEANVTISSTKAEQVQGRIIDNTGRTVMQLQWNILSGSNAMNINVALLAKGIYYLELKGTTINEHKQFIKQ